MSKENVELVKQIYEEFSQGNFEAVLANYSPEIEWHASPGTYRVGGVHRGPQTILKEVFMTIPDLFEEFSATNREYVEAGDRVIALGDYHLKGKATGKSAGLPYVHILTVRDAKLVRFEDYSDTAIWNATLLQ